MIDIHTHVLPGVDDGAPDLLQAEAMLAMAAESGTDVMIATPHWDLRYQFDAERCADLVEQLRARMKSKLRLMLGCEVHLTPEHLFAVLRHPSLYSLGGSDCVLVEFPNTATVTVKPALEALLSAGLRPIVAHPERYCYIQSHRDFATDLVEMGCYLQLTAQSILGNFGRAAEQITRHLLRLRLAHFVASDGHGPVNRRPLLAECFTEVAKDYGQSSAELLFIENPKAILERKPINTMPAQSRSWMQKIVSGSWAGRRAS